MKILNEVAQLRQSSDKLGIRKRFAELITRKIIGNIAQITAPGYSYCGRCGMPWKYTKGHITDYTATEGMFPLCENCWKGLTPQGRLPYYKQLFDDWEGYDETVWDTIELAVLEGN